MYSILFTTSAAVVMGEKSNLCFLDFNHKFSLKKGLSCSAHCLMFMPVYVCGLIYTRSTKLSITFPIDTSNRLTFTTKFSQVFHPGLPIRSQWRHLCLPSALPSASRLVFLPAPASAVFPVSSEASFPSIFSSLLSLEQTTTPRFKQRAGGWRVGRRPGHRGEGRAGVRER